jgi:hypothetical protein
MRTFLATKRDNELNVMRLELSGDDVELLDEAVLALRKLALIEDALGVKGFESPFILGKDQPTQTRAAARLLDTIVEGWAPMPAGDVFVEVYDGS